MDEFGKWGQTKAHTSEQVGGGTVLGNELFVEHVKSIPGKFGLHEMN